MDVTDHIFLVQDTVVGGLVHKAAYDKKVSVNVIENRGHALVSVIYGLLPEFVNQPNKTNIAIVNTKGTVKYESDLNAQLKHYGIDIKQSISSEVALEHINFGGFRNGVLILVSNTVGDPLSYIRSHITKRRSKQFEEWFSTHGIFHFDGKKLEYISREVEEKDSHYKQGNIEPIDIIGPNKIPYCIGAVIKYITRSDYKGQKEEDKRKIMVYLDFIDTYKDVCNLTQKQAMDYAIKLNLKPTATLAMYLLLTNSFDEVRGIVPSL